MDYGKRAVEHYRDHELVCTASPEAGGWSWSIAVVTHDGDQSLTRTEDSSERYRSEIDALRAGVHRARQIVDGVLDGTLKDG